MKCIILFLLSFSSSALTDEPDVLVTESGMVHLRSIEPREWATFPADAHGNRLERQFEAAASENTASRDQTQLAWTRLNRVPDGCKTEE